MTALSTYGTKVASSIIGTAGKLSTQSGGVEGSSVTTGDNTTANNFLELRALGASGVAAVAAIPATPTGNGWSLDSITTLASVPPGVWSTILSVQGNEPFGGSGINLHVRWFWYLSGVYTAITGDYVLNLGTGWDDTNRHTFTDTSGAIGASTSPGGGATLYHDVWVENLQGWQGYASAPAMTCFLGTTAGAGVANDAQTTTPVQVASLSLFAPLIIPGAVIGPSIWQGPPGLKYPSKMGPVIRRANGIFRGGAGLNGKNVLRRNMWQRLFNR